MNTSITIRPVSGRVNPAPRLVADMANEQADRDLQKILDGIIDEEFLRNITNQDDLSAVVELHIKVNSSYQSLLDLRTFLPNLSTLILDASTIVSIRDLGVGLRQLQTLSLNSCGLIDLDGMGVLTGLRKLSLCDNFIDDVTPLAMHENIKELNIAGNKLSQLSVATDLSSCPILQSLDLQRNPICLAPHYRHVITSLIGTLLFLDDIEVDRQTHVEATGAMVKEADSALKMLCEEKKGREKDRDKDRDRNGLALKDSASPRIQDSDILSHLSLLNYSTGAMTPSAGDWDNNRGRDGGGFDNMNLSTGRDGAVGGGGDSDKEWGDTGSLLTHGSSVVLAGNMAAAMRQRKRQTHYNGMKREEGEEGSTSSPSSRSSSTALNSRSSSVTDRGGRESDRDRERESITESAAAVLDLAIDAEKRLSQGTRSLGLNLPSTATSTSTSTYSSDKNAYDLERAVCGIGIAFLGDGDVTHNEADRGESVMHWNALENAGGGTLRGSASLFLSIDDDDYQIGDGVSKPCTPPRPASRGGAGGMSGLNASLMSLAKDMRENWGKQNVESTFNSLRDSGMSSARGSAAGSALGSARGSALGSARGSGDFSEHLSRMELRDSRGECVGNRGRDSPRQQNDHRPVSASTSRGDSLNNMMRAPSASFKIAIDGPELADLKARVPARKKSDSWSRGRGAVFGDLSGAFEKDSAGAMEDVARGTEVGVGRRVFVEADEDVSTDSEVTDRRLGKGRGSEGMIAPRSIVHRDLVQRHFSPLNSPSASPSPSPSYSEKSGATEGKDGVRDRERVRDRDGTYVVDIDAMCGDSDDESGTYKPYTAVAHATRYRLMSASTVRRVPSPCPSPVPGFGPDGGQNRILVGAALTSHRHYLPHVKSPTTVSAISSRGRAGSVGEGSPHTPRGHTRALTALLGSEKDRDKEKEKGSRTMSSRAGTSLGFDLTGSLAAIGQWVDEMDIDMDTDEDEREEKDREKEYGRGREKERGRGRGEVKAREEVSDRGQRKGRGRESEKDDEDVALCGEGDGEGDERTESRVGGIGDRRGGGRGSRGGVGGEARRERGIDISDTDGEMDGTDIPYRGRESEKERERERERHTTPFINNSHAHTHTITHSCSESPFKILSKDAIMHMCTTSSGLPPRDVPPPNNTTHSQSESSLLGDVEYGGRNPTTRNAHTHPITTHNKSKPPPTTHMNTQNQNQNQENTHAHSTNKSSKKGQSLSTQDALYLKTLNRGRTGRDQTLDQSRNQVEDRGQTGAGAGVGTYDWERDFREDGDREVEGEGVGEGVGEGESSKGGLRSDRSVRPPLQHSHNQNQNQSSLDADRDAVAVVRERRRTRDRTVDSLQPHWGSDTTKSLSPGPRRVVTALTEHPIHHALHRSLDPIDRVGTGTGVGMGLGLGTGAGARIGVGEGVCLSDDSLIELLSLPPRSSRISSIRSRSGYQEFFRGMKSSRMRLLLEMGYAAMDMRGDEPPLTPDQRAAKVQRRMDILQSVLAE